MAPFSPATAPEVRKRRNEIPVWVLGITAGYASGLIIFYVSCYVLFWPRYVCSARTYGLYIRYKSQRIIYLIHSPASPASQLDMPPPTPMSEIIDFGQLADPHRSAGFVRTDGYKMMIDDRGSKRPPCTGYHIRPKYHPSRYPTSTTARTSTIYISAEIYASQFRNYYGVDLSELATRRGGTIEMRSCASKICF